MKKNKLSVTPEEVAAEEEKIRADYSPGDFEKVLVEDYVDLDMWREFLRQDLAKRKLNRKVLRPVIKVTAEEMERYYNENAEKFNKPARLSILVVDSTDKKKLEDLRKEYLASKDFRVFEGKEGIMAHTITPQPDHLPKDLMDVLKKLSPGDATAVAEPDEAFPYNVYQLMIFKESIPAKNSTLPEAYPQVEQALVEQKVEKVFGEWLERELKHSKIEVAHVLAEAITLGPEELRRRARDSRTEEDAHAPAITEPPASSDDSAESRESIGMD